MRETYLWLAGLAVLVSLFLIFQIIQRLKGNRSLRYLLVAAIIAFFWQAAEFINVLLQLDEYAIIYMRLEYSFGLVMLCLVLFFFLSYYGRMKKMHIVPISVVVVALVVLALFTDRLIAGVFNEGGVYIPIFGDFFWIGAMWYFYLLGSIVLLIFIRGNETNRKEKSFLLFGIAISACLGMVSDMLFPYFGIMSVSLGGISMVMALSWIVVSIDDFYFIKAHFSRFSLGGKVRVMIISTAILLTVLLVFSSYIISKKAIEERVLSQLDSVSYLKESSLNEFLLEQINDLKSIAGDESFVSFYETKYHTLSDNLSEHAYAHDLARKQLSAFMEEEENYEEVFIVGVDGLIHLSTSPSLEKKNVAQESFFIEGKKGVYVTNPYYSLMVQHDTMVVSAPMINSQGSLISVIGGRVDLSAVSSLMTQRTGLGDTGETYLVNNYNYMITSSRFQEGLEFKKAIYSDVIKDCLMGKDSKGTHINYLGTPVIGVYRWMPQRKMCIVSEISQSEAFMPITRLRNVLFLVGSGLIVVFFFISLYFSRMLTKQMNKLLSFTESISKGNFGETVSINSGDEIEDLARSFNIMSVELKKYDSDLKKHQMALEKTVSKRTNDLQEKIGELERTKRAIMNILEDTNQTNTELSKAREELRNNIDKLNAMNKNKDEFISITAHELKTPLTSIKGFSELLKNESVLNNKEQRDKYFNIIIEDTQRLSKLITDMLDLTRLDLGTMKFFFEKTTAEEMLEQLKNLSELQVKAKGLKFICKTEKIPGFYADKSRLTQVLSNLVNNSIKYTEKGSIIVSAFKKEDYIHFSVVDTGVGIPKDAQPNLFQRFYQADSSYTRKVGGSGLGLSICKGIVEAMGGSIWFRSVPGNTHFELKLKYLQRIGKEKTETKVI
ncbi:MAG: ATP-binding protein [Candidatus Woesearchaeota archaeon]|nr:ATP-binding protein [Candidatus Woesearchaeota archaeon]